MPITRHDAAAIRDKASHKYSDTIQDTMFLRRKPLASLGVWQLWDFIAIGDGFAPL
jgi:hypothetical protein